MIHYYIKTNNNNASASSCALGGRGAGPGTSGVAGERRSLPVGPYTAAQRDRETAAGAPVQGQVDVRVRIENAPPGTTADVTSQGAVRAPPPEVGYSFMNLY